MTRRLTQQAAHTYGVLDELMIERRDTKFVAGSLADGRDIIVLPQGGYVDRGGSTRYEILRQAISAVTVTAGLLTAPNSGTVANLIDEDEDTFLTTNAVDADPFVIFECDFGVDTDVSLVDLIGFKAGTATDDVLQMQYWDGADWQDFGNAVHVRTTGRSRRFGRSPGLGNLTTQKLRAVITGGVGPGIIEIAEFKVYEETTTLSIGVCRTYNYSVERYYQLVITDQNIDIFRDGVWQAAAGFEGTSSILREVKHEPAFDTVLFFHQDMPPQRLLRQGSDTEWNFDRVPWENVPLVDYGDVYTNGVNEIQEIRFYTFANNDEFELTLEGNKTAAITYSTTSATTIDNIKAGLEELTSVDEGLTVTFSDSKYAIEFSGGENEGRDWLEMEGRELNLDGFLSIRTSQKAVAAGEDIMSETQGWPAVGRFVQGRLLIAGFKNRPQTYIASVSGDPFNLDTSLDGSTAAMQYDIDDNDINTIREITVNRTVTFLTDAAVWHLENAVLDAEDVPERLKSDAPGISAGVRIVSSDNAGFYIQRGGQTMRSLTYSELEQNFLADNASVISASLVDDPIDIALRRSVQKNDADLIFLVNGDGSFVTVTLLRTQDVSGFVPHRVADADVVSIMVDAEQDTWWIAQRDVSGTDRLVLEKMEPDKLLDGAMEYALDPASSELTGLDSFEGQDMHVHADGEYFGEYTVTNGTITLDEEVSEARCGFWHAPYATDTPYQPEEEAGVPLAKQKRVYECDLSVKDTTSVAIIANGGDTIDLPLTNFDDTLLDTAPEDLPFTGTLRAEGMPGWTETAQLTVTQTVPGRLTVRSVKKEIAA